MFLLDMIDKVLLTTGRPRPHLITSLYERFPSKCSTCGKRFASTAEGKEKKARHYDWHFRIRMKREDAAKRGQSRSWYVSELVRTREFLHILDRSSNTFARSGLDGGRRVRKESRLQLMAREVRRQKPLRQLRRPRRIPKINGFAFLMTML